MTRSRSLLVALAAVVAVLIRIPRLRYPLSPDEAGFLTVGGGWNSAGPYLYGEHWVDRPPLLITIFRIAELAGGMVPLRIIGLLVTALSVWLASRAARSLAGPAAAVPTAWIAALLLSTPIVSFGRVDGELLATPFVLAGIWASISALSPGLSARASALRAALSGAAAVSAILVKQNFVDVVLFVGVAGLAALVLGRLSWARAGALIGSFLVGALGLGVVMLLWSWNRGTSPLELYEALYPFRIEAAQAINDDSPTVSERRVTLRWAALLGGAIPLTAVALPLLWRRPRPTTWALFAVIAYGGVSVVAGGSAWLHYLIQWCGPVAVAAGVAFAQYGKVGRHIERLVLAAVLAVAIGSYSVDRDEAHPNTRARTGEAIAAVAGPGDRITVFPFGVNISYATGLETPYPYLWLLPALVRDTDLDLFAEMIESEHAPTWIVLSARPSSWPGYGFTGPTDLLDERYAEVAELCGRPTYLLRDADRDIPVDPCGTR
ncbi:hypothetical protein D9V41_09730 [Aeromicrobium phragmitis]|uniref:Glycosyltransferase RgtA/B/C/D-like domain-containing protein n=1 Tax=Aeromicrobium phragmitis TaxID=2478914 RepID=A0A3L8PK42_9ACTN|nr:hypothetical protein [Aeromicrobium phragmitis]RLV55735.1 hypothetical protein D9V41_09730 [Aeromicrobium phragmitis]